MSGKPASLRQYLQKHWPWLVAAALLVRFAYKVIEISSSFPNLFQGDELLGYSWPLLILPVASALIVGMTLIFVNRDDTKRKQLIARIREVVGANAPGLVLGVVFFILYFVLAAVFNRTDFNNNNVFFAADTHQWQLRLADPFGASMEMRAIHPLAFLLLRPLSFILSFLSGTDLIHCVVFLLAAAGSLSVYLVWFFIRETTGSQNHGFLFASIFGISTAQLMFNTITETYIFSGVLLVLFFILLQKNAGPAWIILTGIGIFGITISNLVQAEIGLYLTSLKVKRAIVFAIAVVAAAAGLSLLNKAIYPSSGLFFNPADYAVEDQHLFRPSENYSWSQRASLVASDMFGFSIVAPQPYLQSYNKDDRGEFPKFNFMQGTRLSRFTGTGRIAILVWLGLLGISVVASGRVLKQEGFSTPNRLVLTFLLCLAFNFVFHLAYGFEPFLYAADWTYALIFLVGLSLRAFADSKWLSAVLLILLALLTLNNLSFLYFLMRGISPYIVGA